MPETRTIPVPDKWQLIYTHRITYAQRDGSVSVDTFPSLDAAERALRHYPTRGKFAPYIGEVEAPYCVHGKRYGECPYFDGTGVCVHHKLAGQ